MCHYGNSDAVPADVCATTVSSYAALCKAFRRGVHVTVAVLEVWPSHGLLDDEFCNLGHDNAVSSHICGENGQVEKPFCSSRHKLLLWPTHSNPKIMGVCLFGDNAAGAWMLPFTRMWCVESYFRHSLRLRGLALLRREDSTFTYFCVRWDILRSCWSLVWTLKI